jgi:ACS family glucarate transporter-like MFS transporter
MTENPPANEKPTRVRYAVVAFAIAVAVITYADRVCLSNAKPLLQKDLGLTDGDMKWAYWAFFFAYAMLEIPAGWLGDRLGPRKALTRVVLLWSVFTALTGRVWSAASLILVQLMFGAGEAGCFPNVTRAFANWLPAKDRARAQGAVWLSARWGGAFTPFIVFILLEHMSWRGAFTLFGCVGIVWAAAFWIFFRDRPEDHKGVNAAERALLTGRERGAAHGPVPWRAFLRSRTVKMLWLQYMSINFWWPFYLTYLPTYVKEVRGLDLKSSPALGVLQSLFGGMVTAPTLQKMLGALLTGLPLFLGGIGCLLAGSLAAPLARKFGNLALVRKRLAMTGCLCAAAFLVISTKIDSPTLAMFVLAMASFSNDLLMPSAWATCMDVGGRYSGTLSGSMNMMGNLAASLFALAAGYLLEVTHNNWNLLFFGGAAFYVVAAVAWKFIDPNERLDTGGAQ